LTGSIRPIGNNRDGRSHGYASPYSAAALSWVSARRISGDRLRISRSIAWDGKAHLLHVELGHLNDTEVEVLSDVAEGDQVNLHPSDRIADGVPVRQRG
jgi:HlyD family secretion protein